MRKRNKNKFKKFSLKDMFKPIVEMTRGKSSKAVLEESLDLSAGLKSPLENPDELLWDKGKNLTLYDTMLLDSKIKFVFDLKKLLTLSVPGKIVPGTEEDKDIEIADFINDTINDMKISWKDVQENLLDSMAYGNKVGELRYDMKDGKIIWNDIKFKHSIFFDFGYDKDSNFTELYVGQKYGFDTVVKGKELEQKFIMMVYPYLKDGNMYGDSDLREVYTEYYVKFNILRFRNVYLQNFGQPIPFCVYESGKMSDTELEALEDTLENFQDQMYMLVPGKRLEDGTLVGKVDVEWRDATTKSGTDQYEKAIIQLNNDIMWKMLIPSKLGFGLDGAGSFAQSQEIFKILKKVIKNLHERLENAINPKIKVLVDMNFEGVENYPEWKYDEIDKTLDSELLKILVENKIIDSREKWIRGFVNIPELTTEEQEEIDELKEEDKANLPPPPQPGEVPKGPAFPFPTRTNKGGGPVKMKNAHPVDFKALEKQLDEFEADFSSDYQRLHAQMSEDLIKQVQRKKIVEDKRTKALATLRIPKSEMKRTVIQQLSKAYLVGKTDAVQEVEDRIKKLDLLELKGYEQFQSDSVEWLDRNWIDNYLGKFGSLANLTKADKEYLTNLRDQGFFITGETEERMLKGVRNLIDNGIKTGDPGTQIVKDMQEFLQTDRQRYATTIARTNIANAYNTGRMNEFTSPEMSPLIQAYEYQAILDNVTTAFCQQHDGQIVRENDPVFSRITPPNHFNCRSILTPILIGENEDKDSAFFGFETNKKKFPEWGTKVPVGNRLPQFGFGGVKEGQFDSAPAKKKTKKEGAK